MFFAACGGSNTSNTSLVKDTSGEINYVRDIWPIFAENCVSCHGPDKQKSGLRVDQRVSLLRGGDIGAPAIVPKELSESYLLHMIELEDPDERMPLGKEPLSKKQINLIENWIEQGAKGIDFDSDVWPIFAENCVSCHGPEKEKSSLRVDQRNSLLRGGDIGVPALVPGDPSESYLVFLLEDEDADMRMPLGKAPLSIEEIDLIKLWITDGASWPSQMEEQEVSIPGSDLWSIQELKSPDVPSIKNSKFPIRNPIDEFIQSSLNAKGLQPSEEADPLTLIRRASIILTGLPPTYEETQKFISIYTENSDLAYDKLVETLMASPHFGERWAQHWLDAIRWSETSGSEDNMYRVNAWWYRDWLVEAFNEDKPYDEFVHQQLAGDILGEEQATGFLVSGPYALPATIGRVPSEVALARADRLDETIQTVAASIQGQTMACARCHNHKFDPITIRDYYSMVAVFKDVEYGFRWPQLDENDPLNILSKNLKDRIDERREELKKYGYWEEIWPDRKEFWFPPIETESVRFTFGEKDTSKSISVFIDEIEIFGPGSDKNLNLSSDGVEHKTSEEGDNPGQLPHNVNDGGYVNSHYGPVASLGWGSRFPQESKERPNIQFVFPQKQKINRAVISSNRTFLYLTDYTLEADGKPTDHTYAHSFKNFKMEAENPDGVFVEVFNTYNANDNLDKDVLENRENLISEIDSLAKKHFHEGPKPGFIGRFVEPTTTHIFQRGSPASPGAEVVPAGLEVLDGDLGLSSDTPGPDRRLAFAKWLTDQNPLTPRVMVNRLWHHVFGQGIVTTLSDFGFAGSSPTHPELLDWLAMEFVENGWSVKYLLRMMVSSHTFKQASFPNEEGLKADGNSQFLWRYPPKRAEAEVLRDGILLSAGTLDMQIGGEGYRIHGLKKLFDQWAVTNNYGEHSWRRMLYQERMRRVNDLMFMAFDFPDCGQVLAKRPVSTTPLQALNMMNSPFVNTQVSILSDSIVNDVGRKNIDEQVEKVFELILTRKPKGQEIEMSKDLVTTDGLDALTRALFNSNEFAFIR